MELNKKLTQKKQRELIDEYSQMLTKIYSELLTKDQMKVAQLLIDEISFMRVNLHVLKHNIIKNGSTYLMKNGSQEMFVENPASKVYNATIPKYNNLFNSLSKMLPQVDDKETDDKADSIFEKFVVEKL